MDLLWGWTELNVVDDVLLMRQILFVVGFFCQTFYFAFVRGINSSVGVGRYSSNVVDDVGGLCDS